MDGHSSSGPVTVLLLAALTSSVLGQGPLYFSVGDSLVLTPPKHGSVITSAVWTHNTNLVVEWVNNELEFYRLFKGRTELDQSTAKLTVNKATQSDAGEYKVEINNVIQPQVYKATGIKKVPKPEVVVRTPSCGPTSGNCNFTCQGDTAGTQPLTYSWRMDSGEWEQGPQTLNLLADEKTKLVKQISCSMKNPVSKVESDPLDNPMHNPGPEPNNQGKVAAILVPIVFVVLVGLGLGFWQLEAIKKFYAGSDTSGEVGKSIC
ncbi:uncharacterized protein LOC133020981 [Limanda limanda]|uniref:uncharacterized protein LOC133020981 n=1 Tax=Limanda limanda TaxID=27771 RepID=UPI0029C99CF1|nr:uncharacterized protein LOC133020981 [Limanda limanda]